MNMNSFEDGNEACPDCGRLTSSGKGLCEHMQSRRAVRKVVYWAIGIGVLVLAAVVMFTRV